MALKIGFQDLYTRTAGIISACTEVNTLSRDNHCTLEPFKISFEEPSTSSFALLGFPRAARNRYRPSGAAPKRVEKERQLQLLQHFPSFQSAFTQCCRHPVTRAGSGSLLPINWETLATLTRCSDIVYDSEARCLSGARSCRSSRC